MMLFPSQYYTGLLLLSLTANAFAATSQSITLPLSYAYETNPLYSASDKRPISRVSLTPQYSITSNKGANQWFSGASLNLVKTSDQSISQDRSDPSLNMGWTHNYETGRFSVTGLLNDQSTQVTEFTDSGLIAGDNTKKIRTASLNWSNSLTERTSLTLGGNITNASFHGVVTTGLVNYKNESSNAKLNYALSERADVFTQFTYSRYLPENSTNTSNTKSINLGFTWTVSEIINTTVSIGANETENNNNSSESWQANINTNYATPRTNTLFSLSRSLDPSSTGNLSESNQLALGWSYSLTERDNISLNMSWQENLSTNKTITNQISANYAKELNLSWDFRLTTAHNSREDKLTNVSSNSIMASIIYKLPDF